MVGLPTTSDELQLQSIYGTTEPALYGYTGVGHAMLSFLRLVRDESICSWHFHLAAARQTKRNSAHPQCTV